MTRKSLLASALLSAAAACSSSPPAPEIVGTASEAITTTDVLGFDSPSGWTVNNGTTSPASKYIQGSGAVALTSNGYAQLTSVAMSTLKGVTSTIGLDLGMPSVAPNPHWLGTLALTVSVPSQNLNNAPLGQIDLGTLTLGQYNHVQFTLPSSTVSALQKTYSDLHFQLSLNVPQSSTAAYLFDDMHFIGHSDAYGTCFENPKSSKVKVLVYDQYHLSKHRDEATHNRAIVDPVASSHQLVDILRQTSHGLLNYQITDVQFIDGQPPQMAGGGGADYGAIFQQNNLCGLVQNQNLSEVWIWADNSAGFDELAYKVPNDAVPNDSQAESPWFYDLRKKNIPDCGKTIWVMGWNYMVPLENALHSYDHRIESIVSLLVGQGHWLSGFDTQNPWYKFSLWDQAFPGQAGVGTTHLPANATFEYDYVDPAAVPSTALDFQNYPALTGAKTSINCSTWGCSQLGYQQWYESLIPHASGNGYAGTCNSWWTYIADFDRRLTPCSGASCLQPLGAPCDHDSACGSGSCACGACVAAGSSHTCRGAAFDSCSSASQCASGLCGCPGETASKACLPNSTYSANCAQPAGGECWFDGDCGSGACGCNGGSVVSCLPSGQSRACANITNWNPCTQNSDCQSGVCGCFANLFPMECLPNSLYLSTCPQ